MEKHGPTNLWIRMLSHQSQTQTLIIQIEGSQAHLQNHQKAQYLAQLTDLCKVQYMAHLQDIQMVQYQLKHLKFLQFLSDPDRMMLVHL